MTNEEILKAVDDVRRALENRRAQIVEMTVTTSATDDPPAYARLIGQMEAFAAASGDVGRLWLDLARRLDE